MTALDSAALKSWEKLADVGTWLVIAGVAGEGIEIVLKIIEHKSENESFSLWYKKHEFFIDIAGGIFWSMVVIGLVMEFKGSHKSQQIVQNENSRITQEAGEAIGQAGLASERAANTESNNLVLRSNLINLQALMLPITFVDPDASSRKLSKFSGAEIRIRYAGSSSSSLLSAYAVGDVLTHAGWNVRGEGTTNAEFSSTAVISINSPDVSDKEKLNKSRAAALALQVELVTNGVTAVFDRQVAFKSNEPVYAIILHSPIKDGPGPDQVKRRYFFNAITNPLIWAPQTN